MEVEPSVPENGLDLDMVSWIEGEIIVVVKTGAGTWSRHEYEGGC